MPVFTLLSVLSSPLSSLTHISFALHTETRKIRAKFNKSTTKSDELIAGGFAKLLTNIPERRFFLL